MLPILGIDISKNDFHVELSVNEKLRHRRFSNRKEGYEELGRWLTKNKVELVHACMEATGTYGEELAIYLHKKGHTVSVVNPARIKAFGQSEGLRNKDDRPDAALIRRFCEKQQPAIWTPAPEYQRELRALTRHLENLYETRQQQENRLEGIKMKEVVKSMRKIIASITSEIQRTEKQIEDHIDNNPELKRQCDLIESIKGIGKKTAAKLVSEIENLEQFKSARQVAAYAGLTPKNNRSGNFRGRTRLSKTGNARVRKALFLPAMVAKKCNPIVKAFCDRLAKNGKNKMQIIGAAMRKLIHIVFGVLKSGNKFDQNYEQKFLLPIEI